MLEGIVRQCAAECLSHRLNRNQSRSNFLHSAQCKSISVLLSYENKYCRQTVCLRFQCYSVTPVFRHAITVLDNVPLLGLPRTSKFGNEIHSSRICGFDDEN